MELKSAIFIGDLFHFKNQETVTLWPAYYSKNSIN